MEIVTIQTTKREQLVSISSEVTKMAQSCLQKATKEHGAILLFCPHTTCGLTINEGADPDVAADMVAFLQRLVPQNPHFRHREGNSDAHIKASFLGSSLYVPVEQGRLRLGTWQTIYLFEGDGPRKREVWLSLL